MIRGILFAVLGFVLGGPIGAVIGFLLGYSTRIKINTGSSGYAYQNYGQIDTALLTLAAYVIKSDGGISREELTFVRNAFIQQFGTQRAEQAFRDFNKTDKQIDVAQLCRNLTLSLGYSSRINVLSFLFQVALSDGPLTEKEQRLISYISDHLGIHPMHYQNVYQTFAYAGRSAGGARQQASQASCYRTLEVEEGASVEQIKKSYRILAKKYHPDRAATLSPEEQELAKKKFQEIQAAYAQLKKELNFA